MDAPDYYGTQYRLRAGSPMPTMSPGFFVLHTFMAEENTIDIYLHTKNLLGSEEFRGQGGPYSSANFSRLTDRGGNTFQGKVVRNVVYVTERAWNSGGSI
jgi:hypothetical protein